MRWVSLWQELAPPLLAVVDTESVEGLKPPGVIGKEVQRLLVSVLRAPKNGSVADDAVSGLMELRAKLDENKERVESFFVLIRDELRQSDEPRSPRELPSSGHWPITEVAKSCGISDLKKKKALAAALARKREKFPSICTRLDERKGRGPSILYDIGHPVVREVMNAYRGTPQRRA